MAFAETMQRLLKEAEEGSLNALSLFMHKETSKHFRGHAELRV